MLFSKPFPGGLEMTSRGMYTVKTCQGFILSLVNSWDIIKPSSTSINPDWVLWMRVFRNTMVKLCLFVIDRLLMTPFNEDQ